MIALARRYRPKRFADLLVQDHVAAVLRGAVARARVGHAYLLTGPRGVGKTTAARILAMALNCPNRDPEGEPCGECDNCQRVWTGAANLDVVEIDAASNRGVDDARDLRERAMYAASQEGRYKVYIIDEAHMLTREAWNALLKILEEPPPRVVFVFATTEPHKIAAAAAPVLSRLQRFDFRRIGPTAIRDRLRQVLATEGIAADDDALTLIARHADGGMRDALSVLDQCLSFGEGAITVHRVREVLGLVDDEIYAEVLRIVAEGDAAGVFPLIDRLVDAGADLAEFMGGVAEALRAFLVMQLGSVPEGTTEALRQALEGYRDRLEPGDVLRMLRLLADNEAAIRRSANPRLIVETLLLRWAMLDRMVDLRQVLEGRSVTPSEVRAPEPGRTAADRAAAPSVAAPPPTTPAAVPATFDALRDAWPSIVATIRSRSPMVGASLVGAEPTEFESPWLTIRLAELSAPLPDRQVAVIEEVLREAAGEPLRVRFAEAAAGADRPRIPSDASIKADRLKEFRAKDPTLDTAATELDLEIVE